MRERGNITNWRTELRHVLGEYFSEGDLRLIAFDLNLDFEIISGSNKLEKIIGIIDFFEKSDRIEELIVACKRQRPNVNWDEIASAAEIDRNQRVQTRTTLKTTKTTRRFKTAQTPKSHVLWILPIIAVIIVIAFFNYWFSLDDPTNPDMQTPELTSIFSTQTVTETILPPDTKIPESNTPTPTETTPPSTPTNTSTVILPQENPDFWYYDSFDQQELSSPLVGEMIGSEGWIIENNLLRPLANDSLLLIGASEWDNYVLEFSATYSETLQSPHTIKVGFIDKDHTLNFAIWSDYRLDSGYCDGACAFIKQVDIRGEEGISSDYKYYEQPALFRIEVSNGHIKVYYDNILVQEFDSPIDTKGYVGISGSKYLVGINFISITPLASAETQANAPTGTATNVPQATLTAPPTNTPLIAHWQFDCGKDGTDGSGNFLNGELRDDVHVMRSDNSENCFLNFNSTSGLFVANQNEKFAPDSGQIGVWFRVSTLQNADLVSGSTGLFGIRICANGNVMGQIKNSSSATPWSMVKSAAPIIETDKWHHVVIRWSESLDLFFDGEQIDSNGPLEPLGLIDSISYFNAGGATAGECGGSFIGQIDEITFYEGITSNDDIRASYENFNP